MKTDLLTAVRSFLAETGMGPTYFGKLAGNDEHLVERLERGGRVWPETEKKIRAFMRRKRAARSLEAAE